MRTFVFHMEYLLLVLSLWLLCFLHSIKLENEHVQHTVRIMHRVWKPSTLCVGAYIFHSIPAQSLLDVDLQCKCTVYSVGCAQSQKAGLLWSKIKLVCITFLKATKLYNIF